MCTCKHLICSKAQRMWCLMTYSDSEWEEFLICIPLRYAVYVSFHSVWVSLYQSLPAFLLLLAIDEPGANHLITIKQPWNSHVPANVYQLWTLHNDWPSINLCPQMITDHLRPRSAPTETRRGKPQLFCIPALRWGAGPRGAPPLGATQQWSKPRRGAMGDELVEGILCLAETGQYWHKKICYVLKRNVKKWSTALGWLGNPSFMDVCGFPKLC